MPTPAPLSSRCRRMSMIHGWRGRSPRAQRCREPSTTGRPRRSRSSRSRPSASRRGRCGGVCSHTRRVRSACPTRLVSAAGGTCAGSKSGVRTAIGSRSAAATAGSWRANGRRAWPSSARPVAARRPGSQSQRSSSGKGRSSPRRSRPTCSKRRSTTEVARERSGSTTRPRLAARSQRTGHRSTPAAPGRGQPAPRRGWSKPRSRGVTRSLTGITGMARPGKRWRPTCWPAMCVAPASPISSAGSTPRSGARLSRRC